MRGAPCAEAFTHAINLVTKMAIILRAKSEPAPKVSAPIEPSMDPDSPGYKDMSKFFVTPDENDESSAPSICLDALDISDNMNEETEQAIKEKTILASTIEFIQQVAQLPIQQPAVDDNEVQLQDEDRLYDLIVAYLRVVPAPTDEQFHMLATAIGVTPEELEAFVYQVTANLIESAEPSLF